MPPTGVFVRTSVNQRTGATHPLSQFVNAIIVLLITAVTMPAFQYLPLSSIASLLTVAAINMVPVPYLKHLWRHAKGEFCLCLFTALVCCAVEPIIGIVMGTLVAYLRRAMASSNTAVSTTLLSSVPSCRPHDHDRSSRALLADDDLMEMHVGEARVVSVTGAVTYANCDAIQRAGTGVTKKSSFFKASANLGSVASPAEGKGAGVGAEDTLTEKQWTGVILNLEALTELDIDGAEVIFLTPMQQQHPYYHHHHHHHHPYHHHCRCRYHYYYYRRHHRLWLRWCRCCPNASSLVITSALTLCPHLCSPHLCELKAPLGLSGSKM
jgi:hypothetical protein